MLELTVEPDARELSVVRHRIAELMEDLHESETHIWCVSVVASELLTLSIVQGNRDIATLRLTRLGDATRVELTDGLEYMTAFDSPHGRLITRVASIWGVLREPVGNRTVWCDITRA